MRLRCNYIGILVLLFGSMSLGACSMFEEGAPSSASAENEVNSDETDEDAGVKMQGSLGLN